MKTAIQLASGTTPKITFQDASIDIWDKKYRLKTKDGTPVDETLEDTYRRVAEALAAVEAVDQREHWNERFLWALKRGAIPAGRIMSNAGALAHKPATSTINCTVSGTIRDSMHDILDKVHEAGLTLKAGCGIGYEFSTLRPRGAYVSGAGAYTSGPLSFMDIYDKMCFTVSSAGGRRGAQMGTFDIGHPDALDFVRAKREDGRLRQFNLSLLVSDEFMLAVKNDLDWQLAFPIVREEAETDDVSLDDPATVVWREWPSDDANYIRNELGLTACKIYRALPAHRVWDLIMSSTFDFAEPGFVLVDRVNEMNNNWFAENIRATNPCVTADTWVHTTNGPRQVSDLIGRPFTARVDGSDHASGREGFFATGHKPVLRVRTAEGYQLRVTADHLLRRVRRFSDGQADTDWCPAGELREGDRLVINNHRRAPGWAGGYTAEHGYLMGLWLCSGRWQHGNAVLAVGHASVAANAPYTPISDGLRGVMSEAMTAAKTVAPPDHFCGWREAADDRELHMSSTALAEVAVSLGLQPGRNSFPPALEKTSSDFHRGLLRACFDAYAEIEGREAAPLIRLRIGGRSAGGWATQNVEQPEELLASIQRSLLRLGIVSTYDRRRAYLDVCGEDLAHFAARVGFADPGKAKRLATIAGQPRADGRTLSARVASMEAEGLAPVYDVQIPGLHCFDANGVHAHNCGEQPLPPYGSCLLGSVNLTKFVFDPFTDNARFDWDDFREVVRVFTRMLDNVVEINGLPLGEQRVEIERKRRHGMGFLGLGSTITMLRMSYGSEKSVSFTERVARELAVAGWETALELSREKGPAPIMLETFEVTPEMLRKRPEMIDDGWQVGNEITGRVLHARYSRYMQRVAEVAPDLVDGLASTGARFTHHSSIAPTGTISLSLANNASNGIEPSFAHHYFRNVIREGRKTKEKIGVFSFELLAYRQLIKTDAMPDAEGTETALPDYFVTAEHVTPRQHVDIQAAAQKWVDSSISKTANVPTDYDYQKFKDIYMYAYEQGLKGCTTFRFNPEAFQGVLVKEKDLENTTYMFTLDDGSVIEAKGNDEIVYDGETHTAANLFDALKEGYYGKF